MGGCPPARRVFCKSRGGSSPAKEGRPTLRDCKCKSGKEADRSSVAKKGRGCGAGVRGRGASQLKGGGESQQAPSGTASARPGVLPVRGCVSGGPLAAASAARPPSLSVVSRQRAEGPARGARRTLHSSLSEERSWGSVGVSACQVRAVTGCLPNAVVDRATTDGPFGKRTAGVPFFDF